MNKQIDPFEIDSMILQEIVHDIVSGSLLLNADNETLNIMLVDLFEIF